MSRKVENSGKVDSLESYISIFQDSDLGVIICDDQGTILAGNEQWDNCQKKTPTGSKNSLFDFIKNSYHKTLKEILSTSLSESKSHCQIVKFNTAESYRDLAASIIARKFSDDPIQHLITFKFSNTNEEVDTSMANLFANLSNNLSEGIFRKVPGRGLIYANKALSQLFGYNNELEMVRLPAGNFYASEDVKNYIRDKAIEEGFLKNEVVEFKKKDGNTFWGLVNCTRSETKEGKKFYDGAVVDITEQKASQELLKNKNLELKKINMQMDRFLYSASHDIRSPMTSIMGLANILRMEIDESKHTYLDKIDASLRKLDYFIREIMQFSQNARTRTSSDKIDFNQLVNQAWQKENGPNSKIILKFEPPTDSYYFYTDKERLLIVLSNLFKNAIQFANPDVTESKVEVKIDVRSHQAILSINDNGQGIEESHLENVFDMFYRAHPRATGSGMGLYIVKETLTKMGGTIELTSTPFQGTQITVFIPNDSKGKLMSKKMNMSKGKNYLAVSK